MAGMAVDGLVTGMDTTSLINQLMQLEAVPQSLLKSKVTKTESVVGALQALNSKLSSLADAAKKAADPTLWTPVTAKSTATSVTASATSGAQASSLTFEVEQLATAQTSLSKGHTTLSAFFDGDIPASLTLTQGDGDTATFKNISLSGVTDFTKFADAINKAGLGVTATLVNVNGTTRVQVTGKDTGDKAGFDLYRGPQTAASLAADTSITPIVGRANGADGAKTPGSTVVTTARDAKISLWSNNPDAATPVSSATNTFKDVVSGVSFTVAAVETSDVTVTVGRDDAAIKKLATDLVTNITTVLGEVSSRTKASTTKGDAGRSLLTPGLLAGNGAVRSMPQSILSAASDPVEGISPSTVGVVVGRDGSITFNDSKFTDAMAADPAKVQKVITALAKRVNDVAKNLSDPSIGTLTSQIKGQQSYVKNLNDQVSSWDNRLAMRRTALERTYTQLEVSMSNLNAQSSWLTNQIASWNANTGN